MSQIQFMHSQCPKNKEWSGLLIYKVTKGSVHDLANLEMRAEAMFPMDYGDATFTSFEGDENWLKCFQQFPQIDPITSQPGWYIGKIHDHPNFDVFHSGTDKNDLYTTAPKFPMFLSLIVNYATEVDCQLAIALAVEQKTISRTKWLMKGWDKRDNKFTQEKKVLNTTYVLKCDVYYEQDAWMIDQCKYLSEKKKPTPVSYPTYNGAGYQSYNDWKGITHDVEGEEVSKVRKFVSDKIFSVLPGLITLGHGTELSLKEAIDKTNQGIAVGKKDQYKAAFKLYFADEWYDTYFYNLATDEDEVLEGILKALKPQSGWIVTILREAINELKKEHPELRSI